jgi:outer membrane protein OmpA-like peptidoglycan-associated protein
MMNRVHGASLFSCLIGITLLVGTSQVHAQGKVVYMPQGEVTAQKLIEALKPAGSEAVASMTGKVNCAPYRKQLKDGTIPLSNTAQAGLEVLFTFDSANLGPNATRVLNTLAQALNSKELAPYCFEIQGHTDNVGKPQYNLKLSGRRAASVAGYLTRRGGVAKGRLIAIGYGQEKPLADNATDIGRARNRRVQVRNLGPGQ